MIDRTENYRQALTFLFSSRRTVEREVLGECWMVLEGVLEGVEGWRRVSRCCECNDGCFGGRRGMLWKWWCVFGACYGEKGVQPVMCRFIEESGERTSILRLVLLLLFFFSWAPFCCESIRDLVGTKSKLPLVSLNVRGCYLGCIYAPVPRAWRPVRVWTSTAYFSSLITYTTGGSMVRARAWRL